MYTLVVWPHQSEALTAYARNHHVQQHAVDIVYKRMLRSVRRVDRMAVDERAEFRTLPIWPVKSGVRRFA